jgi:sRNA-binding regulator protein Hfq
MSEEEQIAIHALIVSKSVVRVYLHNGVSLQGRLTAHDSKVLLLEPLPDRQEVSGRTILYKSFVSTIQEYGKDNHVA